MNRFVSLVSFMIRSYWRRSYGLLHGVILGVTCGIFLDPRYAPYSYEYLVLERNFLMIVLSLITRQLINTAYARSLYVILSRVRRRDYYGASVVAAVLITLVFGLLHDVFVLLFAQIQPSQYFTVELMALSLMNIIMVVATAHLWSPYVLGRKYQLAGLLVVFLGAIPGWYEGFPVGRLLRRLSYLFPQLGKNILIQQSAFFLSDPGSLVLSAAYLGIVLVLGFRLFRRKSLSNL